MSIRQLAHKRNGLASSPHRPVGAHPPQDGFESTWGNSYGHWKRGQRQAQVPDVVNNVANNEGVALPRGWQGKVCIDG